MVVLLADVLLLFISSQILTNSYETSLRVLRGSIEASHSSLAILYFARRMNLLANGTSPEPHINTDDQIDYWRTRISDELVDFNSLQTVVLSQFSRSDVKSKCDSRSICSLFKIFGMIQY